MRKFNQCSQKYQFHCNRCEHHKVSEDGESGELDQTKVCSNLEEYFQVVFFEIRWSEIYDMHIGHCEYHQAFLEKVQKDALDVLTDSESEEMGYIN